MDWKEKPIIQGREEVVEVTPDMVEKIKQEEETAEIERRKAADRKENFERRKTAREKGIPFISVEQERQQQTETELQKIDKKKETKAPEMWKSLLEHTLTIIGKIDLEEIQKKAPVVEARPESIFTNHDIDGLCVEALRILGDQEIDEEYIKNMVDDFIHLYTYEDIEKDMKAVIEKEARIKRTDTPEQARLKKIATILEAILVEGIAKYDWLGKKIKILPPSKFDELCHGVDAIIELGRDEEANEFLALGIDVSYRSVNGDLFEEKINNVLNDIDHQHLTQIKYLKNNNGKAIEGLYVPKIVVSVDGKTTEDLVRIWEKRKDEDSKDSLKNHTIAFDIIGQIAEQCKLFSAYARKKGVEYIAEAYDEAFELLLKISEEVPRAKEALARFQQNKFVDKIQELITTRGTKAPNRQAA